MCSLVVHLYKIVMSMSIYCVVIMIFVILISNNRVVEDRSPR